MRLRAIVPDVRSLRALALCALLLISGGCYTAASLTERPSGAFYFKAPYDDVWSAGVAAVTELGFPIIMLSRADGLLTTGQMSHEDRRYRLTVRFERRNGFIKVTPVETMTKHIKLRVPPHGIMTHETRDSGMFAPGIGDIMVRKLGKLYLLELPEPPKDK